MNSFDHRWHRLTCCRSIKPYQWSTVFLDVRANYQDYEGSLQFFPVVLPGMPQEVIYAREARLVKEQRSRLGMQAMLPDFPKEKELNLELLQPGAIRYDELWQVPVRLLPPHQMLVVVLSKESANQYATWNRLPSCVPAGSDREDPMALEIQRYYRMVLPEDAERRSSRRIRSHGRRSATSSGTACLPIPCQSRISKRCSTGCTGVGNLS